MNKQANSSSGPRNRQLGARAAARQERQRRTRLVIIAAAGVAVVLAVVVALLVSGGDTKSTATTTPGVTAETVLASIAGIPGSTYDAVGAGTVREGAMPYAGTAMTADGKPALLYVGAEYCPFCAAQRWAIVAALSRFGSFSNLTLSHSASEDVYPDTATFSFYGSSYTSQYLSFAAVETETNEMENGRYKPLQEPTAAQYEAMVETQASGIPLLILAGQYYINGASFSPALLEERSPSVIAQAMADPTNKISQAAVGAANVITATICKLTGNQPATVCETAGVQAARTALGI